MREVLLDPETRMLTGTVHDDGERRAGPPMRRSSLRLVLQPQ